MLRKSLHIYGNDDRKPAVLEKHNWDHVKLVVRFTPFTNFTFEQAFHTICGKARLLPHSAFTAYQM